MKSPRRKTTKYRESPTSTLRSSYGGDDNTRDEPEASSSLMDREVETDTRIYTLDEATIDTWRKKEVCSPSPHECAETKKRQLRYFRKWGIPVDEEEPSKILVDPSPEMILLGRIVWVKYRPQPRYPEYYLWPAIYYKNYQEIATRAPKVWNQLGLWRRLPIASQMIFDKSNPSNSAPVARLLGMGAITLVEIPSKLKQQHKSTPAISEFHKQLPAMLQSTACNIDYFKHNPTLYYDWHRALDQVESILKECLGDHYVLKAEPPNQITTWYQRARTAETNRWQQDLTKQALRARCAGPASSCGAGTCGILGFGGGGGEALNNTFGYDDSDTYYIDDMRDDNDDIVLGRRGMINDYDYRDEYDYYEDFSTTSRSHLQYSLDRY